MPITSHTIDDGQGRYGSRTRVNRIVYEWTVEELAAAPQAMANIPMNGEIHTIWLDVSASKLGTNADADTVKGSFQIACGDYNSETGALLPYINTITSLDFTNKGDVVYKFQTNEGAMQGNMEHSLSISPGLSAHTTPAAPKVTNAVGAATVIDKNQPWTGRVCGDVLFGLSILGGQVWAPDTGKIRLTILYS